MYFIPTMCEVYNEISLSFYERFKVSDNEINLLTDGNKTFDVLSHTKEEVAKYNSLYKDMNEFLYCSIIFQAFAIEAYVNFIGVNKLDEKEFFEKHERKNTIAKLRLILNRAYNQNLDIRKEILTDINKLFDFRDHLVHFKSKRVELSIAAMENYNPYEFLAELYSEVDVLILTFNKLRTLVNSFEGRDLIDCQAILLLSEMERNIKEMIRKSFGLPPDDSEWLINYMLDLEV